MSKVGDRHVYRVPVSRCGIEDHGLTFSCKNEGDGERRLPVTLDLAELLEEHEELFGEGVGTFRKAGNAEDYIDFIVMERDLGASEGVSCDEDKSVFHTILPDLDLDLVHFCEINWYDGADALDVY